MSWASTSNQKSNFIPVLLRDNEKNSTMKREIERVKKLICASDIIEFYAMGESKIARFYYLLHLTDMIAYYEAILVKKNPSETTELEQLKSILRSSSILPYSRKSFLKF
jgi:ribosomal protein S6